MAYETINTYDYNPVHALWRCLVLAGLSEDRLDADTFLTCSQTVYNEGKGVSALMRDHQSCLVYLQEVLSHIDGILIYGVDGKFGIKLIRDDYNVEDLEVITAEQLLGDPVVERGSWLETVGEIQVQYNQRVIG